jgi:hypothetical protein
MPGKQTFRPKSKNRAVGMSGNDAKDQTRTKPPHLPEVVPHGAADDHILRQVLQQAPPGLLVGLDYQPPIARKAGHVNPPRVDPVEVICHVYCLLLEVRPPPCRGGGGEQEQERWKRNDGSTNLHATAIGWHESAATEMLR